MRLTRKVVKINILMYTGLATMLASVVMVNISSTINQNHIKNHLGVLQNSEGFLIIGFLLVLASIIMMYSNKCPHCNKTLPLSRYCFCHNCGHVLDEHSAQIMREYLSDSVPISTKKKLDLIKKLAFLQGIVACLLLVFILFDDFIYENVERQSAIIFSGIFLLTIVIEIFIHLRNYRCPYCDKLLAQSGRFKEANYCHCCGEEISEKVYSKVTH